LPTPIKSEIGKLVLAPVIVETYIIGLVMAGAQYYALQVLRGAPAGLLCGEVGNRMITRDPDITQLLCSTGWKSGD
jgi:hypothetical protein